MRGEGGERNGVRSEVEEKCTLCGGCRETMKNMCQMLLELSIENNEVYQEDFERPLLKVSRQFYRVGLFLPSTHTLHVPCSLQAESKRLLQENSASDYLKRVSPHVTHLPPPQTDTDLLPPQVEWRIQEESKLAELYLHPTTKKKLTKVSEGAFIFHVPNLAQFFLILCLHPPSSPAPLPPPSSAPLPSPFPSPKIVDDELIKYHMDAIVKVSALVRVCTGVSGVCVMVCTGVSGMCVMVCTGIGDK